MQGAIKLVKSVAMKRHPLDPFKHDLVEIENHLRRSLECEHPLIQEVAQYIITSGGKRIRPVLTVACSRLYGGDRDKAYALSVVPEYLHAASLLHDDVVDEGELRRGKPPAYRVWGNRVTILSGDYLYARAIEIATTFGSPEIDSVIARTVQLMAEGEIIQLVQSKDPSLDRKTYYAVVERKTGALIAASCAIGALVAGAREEEADALWSFGASLGKAFQIVDDCLDYIAEEEEFGKGIGTDLKEKKITLPLIHCFEAGGERASKIMDILNKERVEDEDVGLVTTLISESGALKSAYEEARAHIDSALEALRTAPSSPTRDHLEAISRYILERRR